MLAPGLANAVLALHFVLGVFRAPFFGFRWPSKEAFVPRTDAAFAVQGYQTYVAAGMLAPGLANAVLMQHLVLGCLAPYLPISVAY